MQAVMRSHHSSKVWYGSLLERQDQDPQYLHNVELTSASTPLAATAAERASTTTTTTTKWISAPKERLEDVHRISLQSTRCTDEPHLSPLFLLRSVLCLLIKCQPGLALGQHLVYAC
jgi:hypothetical protein